MFALKKKKEEAVLPGVEHISRRGMYKMKGKRGKITFTLTIETVPLFANKESLTSFWYSDILIAGYNLILELKWLV